MSVALFGYSICFKEFPRSWGKQRLWERRLGGHPCPGDHCSASQHPGALRKLTSAALGDGVLVLHFSHPYAWALGPLAAQGLLYARGLGFCWTWLAALALGCPPLLGLTRGRFLAPTGAPAICSGWGTRIPCPGDGGGGHPRLPACLPPPAHSRGWDGIRASLQRVSR